jgi:hypothetical protein
MPGLSGRTSIVLRTKISSVNRADRASYSPITAMDNVKAC